MRSVAGYRRAGDVDLVKLMAEPSQPLTPTPEPDMPPSRRYQTTSRRPAARVALALALLLGACGQSQPAEARRDPSTLTIVSWNMEHLAQQDGTGCRPRDADDYAAMRQLIEGLDADVIAFQEVESAAAAARVFDPARYTIVIEERQGGVRGGPCRGREDLQIKAQRVGFAIRKGLNFARNPDLTELQLDDGDLRSAVDITVLPDAGRPLRLLSVHLKSGCSSGATSEPCPVFFAQVPVLERWIDARAGESARFAVIGDFNRRLADAGDAVWADWDDGEPVNADLALASGTQPAGCNPRYRSFIDYVVLDSRGAADLQGFREATYEGPPLSDHCPIVATLAR